MNPADNRVRITKMMIRNALLQLLKEKTRRRSLSANFARWPISTAVPLYALPRSL